MGWGEGDLDRVADCKVKTAMARSAFYSLMSKLKTIKHDEKRNVMMKLAEEIYEKLNSIEFHLKR